MCKYGGLTASDVSLRDKLHYEGYMQMNPRNPTPYREENEKINEQKDKEKQAKLGLDKDKTANSREYDKVPQRSDSGDKIMKTNDKIDNGININVSNDNK